ncbi:mitochondrial carrier [Hesseltinella vesiculosa]|uniref:Mitochondrial carrier n=1 Tax=Hesseltinella vesiculosa TaxID=101127 RepID=A0A1X2GU25_9FUNG|nr:mitochondrial carrier [Hesseltinella vesiculosa]
MTTESIRSDPLPGLYPQPSALQHYLQANRTVIAASSAATASVLVSGPFDSVKTRMQTHHYNSMLDCFKITFQQEGTRGFFRGMIPPLITVSAIKSLSFTVYENSKAFLRSQTSLDGQSLSTLMPLATLGGACAGAWTSVFSCPLELVKIQRQLEVLMQQANGVQTVESSSLRAATQIVKRHGMFGLWNGLGCQSARDTFGTAFYFGSYETSKRLLSKNGDGKDTGPLTHFLSGGLCGMASWLLVFPVDLVKSVIQKDLMMPERKYKNARDCARVLGLYRGLSVTLVRAFPIHSLNFLVYEQVLRLIPPPS